VPDVKYIPHENTSLHVRKRNHKWLKLKSYGEARAGIKSLSLWNFLGL